jgi:hypothetical protein
MTPLRSPPRNPLKIWQPARGAFGRLCGSPTPPRQPAAPAPAVREDRDRERSQLRRQSSSATEPWPEE